MTIETTVTEKRTIKKEIALPYYSRNALYCFMIGKDESILKVEISHAGDGGLNLCKKGGYWYNTQLSAAGDADPITKEEFEEATQKAVEFMDEAMSKFQPA